MINRIFLISDFFASPRGGEPEENVYYSLLIQPGMKAGMDEKYASYPENMVTGPAITLNVQQVLEDETIQDLTAFLFLPNYPRAGGRPMINLTGEDPALLRGQAARISAYFTDQGFPAPATGLPLTSDIFRTQDECTAHYEKLLRSEGFFNEIVYFYSPRGEAFAPLIDSLKLQEAAFGSSEPRLYSVVKKNQLYERTVHLLENKLLATENELANQKQYAEILRSGHQSREIQDYYNREYEALPLWFKRLGHLVKVLAGKRTFRSLFRDDVKKHKD